MKKERNLKKYDEAAKEVAKVFECTDSYVRQVIADTKHQRYKGKNPMAIRQAYLKYKHGKQRIINQLQQLKQAA